MIGRTFEFSDDFRITGAILEKMHYSIFVKNLFIVYNLITAFSQMAQWAIRYDLCPLKTISYLPLLIRNLNANVRKC